MEDRSHLRPAALRRSARRNITSTSGMALVMVLAALAVMALLLVALFQGAAHQRLGAESASTLAREKMLADSAAALVIGQIAEASTQTNLAWISQPGLLRTYTTNAVRVPAACYKLYSTPTLTNMVDTSGNVNFFASDVPANWSSTPNQYTDLNAPAQTVGGATFYPILDPAATNSGFGVSTDTDVVTMPVAWLYELQDGTLGPASNGTAANPIVARLAFWTDDETCKVNINTAGCGSAWNTPRVNSTDDVAWSTTQPAVGEYSAYPGHPATTSLAEVLGTNSYSPQEVLALSPRYGWGGSQFGTQPTTNGETVPARMDRLYATLDELRYSTNLSSAGQRTTNAVTPGLIETARFVLTAHSVAPETTLLGEPRIAIWPVADTNSASAPRMTAWDAAMTNAATVGVGTTNMRSYFFQRHNALSPTDDLNTNVVPSNAQLFGDLVARGNWTLPGYGTTLAAKYPGAAWTQLMLEIVDYIRCINAVDPSPAPFVAYATGNGTNGYGFVDPLMTTYGTGTNAITLRAMGRCPTLSSLTLVFYVCGFGFKNGTSVDFEQNPDSGGAYWSANLSNSSTNWPNVTSERLRAFVVPCTFHPACGYPEVSDPCTIQIQGLNGFVLSNGLGGSTNLGFKAMATSRPLSDALSVPPADRAWGGNDGPLAWRAAALDAAQAGAFTYVFAGTNSFSIPLASSPTTNATTHVVTFPSAKYSLTFNAVPLTVLIQDPTGRTLQTLAVNIPNGAMPAPSAKFEFTRDGTNNAVQPSYYMTLRNRVLLTQTNREFMVQPGDTTRTVAATNDLRVIAGLSNTPSSCFGVQSTTFGGTGIPQQHNLHFADGTAVVGASGINRLISGATYPSATTIVTWTNWCDYTTTNYAWPISAPCSCPTGLPNGVYMFPAQSSIAGDWDTGPGFCPDGAMINLPDAGTTNSPANAYFSLTGACVGAPTQRTPNALVPSPVVFGSLPAGINPGTPTNSVPWRTLLFGPYPAADTAHPGFGNVSVTPPVAPDHLVLDNFWMPVVEPYPISTCMATEGKINLNDQIAPFTYLHRRTALHALLNDLRIPAISTGVGTSYKSSGATMPTIWNPVDETATIDQIENKFAGNSADAYLSESEICTVPLVPQGQAKDNVADTQAELEQFWLGQTSPDGGLTGDNLRELPYAQLYSRLTTRSNSYTVHIRVQVLKKLTSDPNQNVWNEGTDVVLGDWRGSYEIERYLDPGAAAPMAGQPLGPYKFRILSARRFSP